MTYGSERQLADINLRKAVVIVDHARLSLERAQRANETPGAITVQEIADLTKEYHLSLLDLEKAQLLCKGTS